MSDPHAAAVASLAADLTAGRITKRVFIRDLIRLGASPHMAAMIAAHLPTMQKESPE